MAELPADENVGASEKVSAVDEVFASLSLDDPMTPS